MLFGHFILLHVFPDQSVITLKSLLSYYRQMREFKEMMWKETGNNWWYSEIFNYEKNSVIYELPHSTGLLERYF